MPIGIERADGGSGGRVGRQAKQQDRRWTPLRPSFRMARRADISSQPAHRARRSGRAIIAGAGKDGNRHQPGDSSPIPPVMKFRHSVGAHQPDEAEARIAATDALERVDGEARAFEGLEGAGPDRRPASHRPGRGEPSRERRHVLRLCLERVAGRDQPPHLVEPELVERGEAHPPVAAMRRVERAAEQADALHDGQAASMAAGQAHDKRAARRSGLSPSPRPQSLEIQFFPCVKLTRLTLFRESEGDGGERRFGVSER